MLSSPNCLVGYKILWSMVMFDLPVVTKKQRHEANKFRLFLLDMGFSRCQLSVYMRFCTSHAQYQVYNKKIAGGLPEGGQVTIVQITDKQYEKIVTYQSGKLGVKPKNPDQYTLF
jgi:CRISPR-associated protein Cas2